MTTKELHLILDDKNCKIKKEGLENIIYEMRSDCIDKLAGLDVLSPQYQNYIGKNVAFTIVLDLLEHLD